LIQYIFAKKSTISRRKVLYRHYQKYYAQQEAKRLHGRIASFIGDFKVGT